MSVIAVKKYENSIDMAADSIVVRGYTKTTNGDFSKINDANGMVIGSVGSAEECSLMWHFMETHKPASSTEKDVLQFMIEFCEKKKAATGVYSSNNAYIMIYGGKAFKTEGLFVHEIMNFDAIGAGEDYALAALHLGHTPREAVKVACELCCYVSEPIIEYSVTYEQE